MWYNVVYQLYLSNVAGLLIYRQHTFFGIAAGNPFSDVVGACYYYYSSSYSTTAGLVLCATLRTTLLCHGAHMTGR